LFPSPKKLGKEMANIARPATDEKKVEAKAVDDGAMGR
jgi:hypothetical protein